MNTTPKVNEEMYNRIRKTVSDVLAVKVENISRNSRFVEDLGADSLDKVSLLLEFESQIGYPISDEDAEGIASIDDLLKLLEKIKA